MAVQRVVIGEGNLHSPMPGGPVASVVIGSGADWPVGVVDVTVPAGCVMPSHTHGSSAALLIPLSGSVRVIGDGDGEGTSVGVGTVATVPLGESVRLENPGDDEAHLLVVLSPPDFATDVAAWPLVGA